MTPFGITLEKYRRRRGLQQNQLAEAIDVSACYISALERGRKNPPKQSVLAAIITTLHLNNQDAAQLRDTAESSKRGWFLPKETHTHEYEFIARLWQRIGTLSEDETLAMSHLLNINPIKQQGGDYR